MTILRPHYTPIELAVDRAILGFCIGMTIFISLLFVIIAESWIGFFIGL
jgi:hypothetical protein